MEEIVTTRGYYYRGSFVTNIVNTIIGIIELFLFARIVLELLGANPSASFVSWIYSISGAFMGPFVGAFPGLYLTQGSVLDIVAVFAMVGYALLGWLILELLSFVFSTTSRI